MEIKILIFLGLANFMIGLISFIAFAIKKETTKGLLLFLFMLFCPIVGAAFLFFSWCLRMVFFKKDIDINDLSFRINRLDTIVRPDYEKEINIIPVEEALLVSDLDNKRRVILDVLKEDYEKSLTVISAALESDDSETSHYVAAIITDVKSNFKITVQKMQENLKQFPNDSEISCLLIDYIHNFLEKKILSEIEELTYIESYIHLMNNLYINNQEAISCLMYRNIINHLLKIGKSYDALRWGERVLKKYPFDLDAYKSNLKLYFVMGEKNKFFDVLTKLKESNIDFDNECLELVRFYQI